MIIYNIYPQMITSFKNGAHDERSYFLDLTTNCNS